MVTKSFLDKFKYFMDFLSHKIGIGSQNNCKSLPFILSLCLIRYRGNVRIMGSPINKFFEVQT